MRGPFALALALALAFVAGCLRIGADEDLHLVCEEKSASPRKAYEVGFLVAQTRIEGELADKDRVAMLEAVRGHVITMGGRQHADFAARMGPAVLRDAPQAWAFDAVAGHGGEGPPDLYFVVVWREDSTWRASAAFPVFGLVRPPHSVAQPAWDTANGSDVVREALPNGSVPAAASWEAATPSCVRLTYRNAAASALDVVVNVVERRVVLVDAS